MVTRLRLGSAETAASPFLFASVSGPMDAGEVPAVILDCGRGDMVVARDEGSAVVLSSTITDSSTPEPEGSPRPDGSSTAIEPGESPRSCILVSRERFGSSAARMSQSGLEGLCMSSGHVKKPGDEGSGGWSDEGVGILERHDQCYWCREISLACAYSTRQEGPGGEDVESRSVVVSPGEMVVL